MSGRQEVATSAGDFSHNSDVQAGGPRRVQDIMPRIEMLKPEVTRLSSREN